MVYSSMGLPPTWTRDLGTFSVSGLSRFPSPAAKMTACIWELLSRIYILEFVVDIASIDALEPLEDLCAIIHLGFRSNGLSAGIDLAGSILS